LNVLATLGTMVAAAEPAVHRWTRTEYDALVVAGAFDNNRVELLDGQIVDMSPTSNRHWHTVTRLHNLLTKRLDDSRFVVGSQGPMALSDFSEPEPDVVIMRNRPGLGLHDHAQPSDMALVVEVSSSSWRYDSGVKLAAYARSGLTEVWLVDLNRNLVHVCRRPIDDSFSERFTVDPLGSLVVPEADLTIAVADFLVPG
jgi:Uma2 family endonuclease